MVSQKRAHQVPVAANYCDGNFLHRFVIFFQCVSRDSNACLLLTVAALLSPRTTTSTFAISFLCCRKLSRTSLFNLFRATAVLIFFFDIANPSLGWPQLFRTANTVNNASADLHSVLLKTRWNSRLWSSLAWREKQERETRQCNQPLIVIPATLRRSNKWTTQERYSQTWFMKVFIVDY